MGKKNNKQKVVLPPELPAEVNEDEIEVSDEDLQFVNENKEYAGLFSKLDTKSITKHVTRVADVKEDAAEALYELRQRRKSLSQVTEKAAPEVDPVDALPVKTLDGKLYYRTVPKQSSQTENAPDQVGAMGENEDEVTDKGLVKLSKAEKRAKLKKMRKEAKAQAKEGSEVYQQPQQTPQVEVLAEVQKDLKAEEDSETKKYRLAELGTSLLMDPEANIKSLKEMMHFSKDGDTAIVILGLKSLLAVFKDIIPGYRIRLPTEKEQQMTVSKAVKKMRFFESTLLSAYKTYLQKLMALQKVARFQRVAIRCICTLLDAVPHFNFRENLLSVVVKNISSPDDVIRKLCCGSIKSLFTSEGKHGGEATVEAVQLIADLVKAHDCQLHPDSVEVFMSLSFDEDLGRPESTKPDARATKKFKKGKKNEEPAQLPNNERKKTRQELISKTREEVNADYKAASLSEDIMDRKRRQSETLSYVFQTYFRILKHTMQQRPVASAGALTGALDHPLLAPCLDGIGKFAHLIDLDFMADLMNYLRKLAGSSDNADHPSGNYSDHLTVSERLRCCIVAFKVMRNNLDALNVDLQEFFVQLYNLILQYRPGRDQGEVLAEALKIMLYDDRHHDMQRAAAFIKRLATFSLCFGCAESMAALVTLKHLLQKNVKCRNLLENDAGGGSLSGPIAKYQPFATDPNLSGALASVLWELNLLSKHYHPSVSTMASSISMMATATNQVYHASVTPQQAFMEMSLERETFNAKSDPKKSNKKRKRGKEPSLTISSGLDDDIPSLTDENELRKKLTEHFLLVRDMAESERLRHELNRTNRSLELYKQFKKQKRRHKQ